MDNIGYNDGSLAPPYLATDQSLASSAVDNSFEDPVTRVINSPGVWILGNQAVLKGPPINFGDIDLGFGENKIPSLDPIPHIPAILNPPISESTEPPSTDVGPCSCLASIYLSLAALQQFPSDVVSALKTVRGAAATAAAAIWCPQCGAIALNPSVPTIEAFQNTMLLGTLLPIIAYGYQRLLKMIDDETDAALAANQTKTFNLQNYGGICGRQSDDQDVLPCVGRDLLFNSIETSPVNWRTTVRALLRVDIYGHESPGFKHKGLKDLVTEMEFRQWARHEAIDAALAAGTLDTQLLGHGFFNKFGEFGEKCDELKIHGCMQMLKTAKIAIDNLIIP